MEQTPRVLWFIDLPRQTHESIELATGLASLSPEERDLLETIGWRLRDAHPFTTDPWRYRDYVRSSRGEFTVAKDLHIRLRSGWFSEKERLSSSRVHVLVTQDTGFANFLPTGEGLFLFNTTEEIIAAFDAINSDYERHSRAARAIAEEYFRAETVLEKVIDDLGL